MKKIFIDCGVHAGESLAYFNEKYQIFDGTWDLHIFEANPDLYDVIVEHIVDAKPEANINFYPVAVVGEGYPKEMTFYREKPQNYVAAVGGGSTIIDIDQLKDGELDGYLPIQVPTTRLANFIYVKAMEHAKIVDGVQMLDHGDCKIILKLDVEGAEYDIIEDLLASSVAHWLNELHVEFHSRRFKEDKKPQEIRLIGELFQQGVACFPRI